MKYKLAVFMDGDFWHGNEAQRSGKLINLEDALPNKNAGFFGE